MINRDLIYLLYALESLWKFRFLLSSSTLNCIKKLKVDRKKLLMSERAKTMRKFYRRNEKRQPERSPKCFNCNVNWDFAGRDKK